MYFRKETLKETAQPRQCPAHSIHFHPRPSRQPAECCRRQPPTPAGQPGRPGPPRPDPRPDHQADYAALRLLRQGPARGHGPSY